MSGATFPRIKNWAPEILTNTDLNAEIDNILNNLGPAGIDDYSSTVTAMKLQTSPGALGSESLATSLGGELERLRFVIRRIIGSSVTYWYENGPSTISDLVAALGAGLPSNRIVSGRTTGNSSQLCALIPSGGTVSAVTLSAAVTPFSYYISGNSYSITANVTLTGLSLAPSTQNTMRLNATAASSQQWTKIIGQYGSTLNVTAMGTGIQALINQFASFQQGSEYFLGYVNSSTAITQCWRGCFFGTAATLAPATGLNHTALITLMRTAWLFATTNLSMAVTYNNPTVSGTQPLSPAVGDYWFDQSTTAWKTYNSTTWVQANATLIGLAAVDTGACVAARTFDAYKAVSGLNNISLTVATTASLTANALFSRANVFGNLISFGETLPAWSTATNLDSGVGVTALQTYYAYLKETGVPVLSDVAPAERRDLQGMYHPGETWRCIGDGYINVSTQFVTPVRNFRDGGAAQLLAGNPLAQNTLTVQPPISGQATAQSVSMYPDTYAQYYNDGGFTISAAPLTWFDLMTISVTPGIWRLSAQAQMIAGTGGTATAPLTGWQLGISTCANTTFAEQVKGINSVSSLIASTSLLALNCTVSTTVNGTAYIGTGTASGGNFGIPSGIGFNAINDYIVRTTDTQNYYVKGLINATAGSAPCITNGIKFTAYRIDTLSGIPQ